MTAAPSDSIAALMALQHDAIDRRLADAARHIDAGELGAARGDLAALAAGLRRHVAIEDAHLFPAYAALPDHDAALVTDMHVEHRAIERLIEAMEAAADLDDRATILRAKAGLHAALGDHDTHEEALCAALDTRLDLAGRRAIIARLGER